MGTRSRIGIQLSDNSILSVYHHWDGYPQWLGRILKTHYNTKEKVTDLIDGGDMSVCWTKDRWTGKKIAKYVIENVEVERHASITQKVENEMEKRKRETGAYTPENVIKQLEELLNDRLQ